jgi:hypothetical protein
MGAGGRQLRRDVRYWYSNCATWIHSCQPILHGDERNQPARVAQIESFLKPNDADPLLALH